ncbi:MAG: ATP-binding protein [Caldilineaceae bacterium]
MFINRQAELAHLKQLYQAEVAQLYVLYGRRRVGKTELLHTFCADKPQIFFVATLSSDADQLATFSQEIWRFLYGEAAEDFTFPSWDAALQMLSNLPGRPVVILDEITYLIEGNKAFPSILQKVWDGQLRQSNLFLALCGSYVGMMEREVMGYQAPLYGRRTGSEHLQPLSLPASAQFFPAYSPIEQIEAWAVLGGMPYYLQLFSDKQTIFDNIQQHILDARGLLYREPQLLLMEELREPRNYFSVLRAIAEGRRRLNEIVQGAGIGDSRSTSRFLDILRQLRVVTRETPVTERQPSKSRKGLYQLSDAFLRFWFRFVHPNQGMLDLGLAAAILEQRVRPHFDQFVSLAFEEAAQAFIAHKAAAGRLPFLPERIGRWWTDDDEIDLVAINETDKLLLVGECKWTQRPVGVNILDDLKRKAARMLGEVEGWQIHYALFAKTGFTAEMAAFAESENVLLITATDMVQEM